jgi:Carboxypeptidase regulatory-like domain
VRQSGARIAGRVATSNGRSAQGALVWIPEGPQSPLPDAGSGTQPQGIQTGADGSFEFTSLPAGAYTLQARLEGYAQAQSAPITLADGQVVSGIEIVLRPGNALEGYVYFNGRAEAGAIVTVIGNGVTEMTTSDADGFYRIEKLSPGSYLASAISFTGNAVAGLFSPLHARVEITEGTTTTYNFGETTNTALEGTCFPPPPFAAITYAVLHLPGDIADLSSLNFSNPASWFGDASASSSSIVGLSVVDRGGYFRMDNLVEGEYQLDVFMGDIMAGSVRQVFSGITKVVNGQVSQVEVPLGQ